MVDLTFFFWIFVVLFAVIGAIRGWAQELLVAFSVILVLFIITVLDLVPFVNNLLDNGFVNPDTGQPTVINATTFWVRTMLVIFFAFFGYQTPRISADKIGPKAQKRSDRVQDTVLGLIVGGINGYLIVGTLWFFLVQADYFLSFVRPPEAGDLTAIRIIETLPPTFLAGNTVYFAIAIAFAFVVIVFI